MLARSVDRVVNRTDPEVNERIRRQTDWCPPLGIVRRLGFRTPQEIEAERHQLLALRGSPRPDAARADEPVGSSAFQPV